MSVLIKFFKILAEIFKKPSMEDVPNEEEIEGEETIVRNLNDKIPGAKNFKYKEFIKSNTALRKGIDNTPTEEHWQNIEKLAVNVLQPVRNNLGRINITSGYRSLKLNKATKGSRSSLHCFGCASDIESEKVSLLYLLEWIYNNCEFRELIYEYPPDGWIHCGYVEGWNAKKLKLKDKDHNYKLVSLDYIKGLYG